MSPDQQFYLAMFAQLAALIVGVASLWLKVESVAKSVDGMKDQLVDKTRAEAHAAGALEANTAAAAAAAKEVK